MAVALVSAVVSACGTTPTSVKESPPTYNFAAASTRKSADLVESIRASITWWVHPVTDRSSAQSTWIGIFGEPDPATHLSLQIAQVGWKQLGDSAVRIFWEWGEGTPRDHIMYGVAVTSGVPLNVELDRDSSGRFSFIANGSLLGTALVSWKPTYVAVGAETHHPIDLMAGSAASPEIITNLRWNVGAGWQNLQPRTFSTYAQYQISADASGTLRIWDLRQS